jgi:hypothetical protein
VHDHPYLSGEKNASISPMYPKTMPLSFIYYMCIACLYFCDRSFDW